MVTQTEVPSLSGKKCILKQSKVQSYFTGDAELGVGPRSFPTSLRASKWECHGSGRYLP